MRSSIVGCCALLVGLVASAGLAPAADQAEPCRTGAERQTVTLALSDSGAQLPVSVVATLSYDASLARPLEPLRAQVKTLASGAMLVPAAAADGLRLVAGRGGGLPAGPLAEIQLARCAGARAPVAADFHCTVDSCAGSGGALSDCTCSVVLH
ncbi:MAG: hypothetical protein SF182_15445 [Deltaproteobacteria bacterium]|nr:hypothetical protein [Deltaproteobacteria bacterium]